MARIAFLLPDFDIGGAERVALTLIRAFLARGHEVDLVLAKAKGDLIGLVPAEVRIVNLGARRLRNALWPLVRYLSDRRPEALQARMWPLTLLAIVARALAGSNARAVVCEDSILSKAYVDRGRLHWLFLRTSIALFYPLANARVTVSEGVAKDLAMLGGLNRSSITVLHNPVALPLSQKESDEIDWGGEGARILAVGNLIPVKNFSLLFAAFAQLIQTRPARLIVVGEGKERAQLESLAIRLGIRDFVTMPGLIRNPEPYYCSADVLVMSSNYEAFPGVLIEALHYGLTAASTDCPTGPREILGGGRYGYLARPGDAVSLAAAIADACDRPFPANVLRARVEELSGPHVIDRHLDMLLGSKI